MFTKRGLGPVLRDLFKAYNISFLLPCHSLMVSDVFYKIITVKECHATRKLSLVHWIPHGLITPLLLDQSPSCFLQSNQACCSRYTSQPLRPCLASPHHPHYSPPTHCFHPDHSFIMPLFPLSIHPVLYLWTTNPEIMVAQVQAGPSPP